MERMKETSEEVIGNKQAGFRTGRKTRDHILNIRMQVQIIQDVNESLHACFIDYSRAFDCIIHKDLWESIVNLGLSRKLILLIQSLYLGQQSVVKTEHPITDWFLVLKGVRQGSMLSPYLFSLYTEKRMIKVYKEKIIQVSNSAK